MEFKSGRTFGDYTPRRRITCIEALVIGAIGVIVTATVGIPLAENMNQNRYVATVTEKTVKRSNEDDKYLIFTKLENGKVKVFENTDNWFRFKFDSSDMYADIKQGTTYEFKTIGWRIPFFSMYENIVEKKELTSSNTPSL